VQSIVVESEESWRIVFFFNPGKIKKHTKSYKPLDSGQRYQIEVQRKQEKPEGDKKVTRRIANQDLHRSKVELQRNKNRQGYCPQQTQINSERVLKAATRPDCCVAGCSKSSCTSSTLRFLRSLRLALEPFATLLKHVLRKKRQDHYDKVMNALRGNLLF